jgi:fructoselysine-6-P-deglycase FrlB-like protein
MEEEVRNQVEDLPRFAQQLRKTHFEMLEPSKLILAGSGDSYAAAIFAQELSGGQAVGSDPYELLTTVTRVRGKSLVIISVSGKTRTNLELARRARRIATERIAVTADESSPLAKECDRVLLLSYRKSGVLTSGTASFTCGLVACAFLLRKLPEKIELGSILSRSIEWARSVRAGNNSSFVFTGSGVNYAVALYGAAKIQEVIGKRAEAEYPEQLGHARLFSIQKKSNPIVCIHSGRDKAWQINELLRKNGFRSYSLGIQGHNLAVNCLKIAVHLQRLALTQARREGSRECAFIRDKGKLDLSNKLIY